jgi:hypothetical protein
VTVLLYLLVPVAVAGVVIGINVYRNRRPTSIEAGMKEFQRGLDALNPDRSRRNGESRRR